MKKLNYQLLNLRENVYQHHLVFVKARMHLNLNVLIITCSSLMLIIQRECLSINQSSITVLLRQLPILTTIVIYGAISVRNSLINAKRQLPAQVLLLQMDYIHKRLILDVIREDIYSVLLIQRNFKLYLVRIVESRKEKNGKNNLNKKS